MAYTSVEYHLTAVCSVSVRSSGCRCSERRRSGRTSARASASAAAAAAAAAPGAGPAPGPGPARDGRGANSEPWSLSETTARADGPQPPRPAGLRDPVPWVWSYYKSFPRTR